MKKREITEWLESQKSQALHKCWEDYEKQKQGYLDTYFEESGLRGTAGQIQEHLEQALRLWLDWKQVHKAEERLSFPETNYLRLERQLDGFVFKEGATYEQLILREVSLQTEELDKLAASRQEMEANVSRNYSRLIRVVSGMKSAADAAEYLKKLGFDLSDLDGEKAMLEIDAAYLFPQQTAA